MSASAPYPPETVSATSLSTDAATAAPVTDADQGERAAWWLALAAAVVGVVVGIMIISWPDATLKIVAFLFGLWLLALGVVRIVQAVAGRGREGSERAILGVIGVFFFVAGVVALRNLLASVVLIVTLIGLMWLIGGLMELVSAFGGARGRYRMWHVALAGLSIIAGIVVLVWPDLSLRTLVYVTGVWLIVTGLLQVAMVLLARRAVTAAASAS
jgi:uncharacterized membrane protein HdeD (DUF308 family)